MATVKPDLQNVRISSLGPAELEILHSVPGTESDEPQPKAEHSLVVVAKAGDRFVATISAERVWLVSNFWADRSVRGTSIPEQVARTIAAMNNEGLAEMLCTTNRHVELLANRMGFIPIKGTLFRH